MRQFYLSIILVLSLCSSLKAQQTEIVSGYFEGFAIRDNYLYLSAGDKILKKSLNFPTSTPTVFINGLSSAKGIAIDGNNLYIAESTANRISVVDLTAVVPEAIAVVGGLNHPVEIVVHNDNLYMRQSNPDKIFKINLTGPPIVTDFIPPTNFISGMTVYNNHLYYCDLENYSSTTKRISRVNLNYTNPAPEVVYNNLGSNGGMAFYNDKLYTNGIPGYNGFGDVGTIAEFDFSTSPPNVKDLISGVGAYQVIFHQEEMYLRGTDGINKISMDNLKPTATDVTYRVLAYGLATKGNDLYIAEDEMQGRIAKVDISTPTYFPSDFTDWGGGDLIVNGEYLYMAYTSAVLKFDINAVNPQPEIIANVGGQNQFMALKNNDLYVSDGFSIFKLDITNPSVPAVFVISVPGGSGGMAFIGNDLFTVSDGGNAIAKINVTDLNPVITTVIEGVYPLWTLTAKGNDIYYADWNTNVILKIDTTVSSPTPIPVVYEVQQVMAMTFKGDILFMTEGTGKITKFDTSSTPMSVAKPVKQSAYVYPVPADNYLKISGLAQAETYTIYSVDGRAIISGRAGVNDSIDVEKLMTGTYILKLENSQAIKFIKR